MKSQSVHGEETWKSLFPRLSINGNFPCFCTGSSEKKHQYRTYFRSSATNGVNELHYIYILYLIDI